jgi:DNA-binding NtrC family response regulator
MEQLRILIVDDEEDLVATMAERLALREIQAQAATSGLEALQCMKEREFDALVLDVKMPGIDGLQLMAEIRRKHPDLPVILLTGHGSAADAEKGIRLGAFDYLMKPVDIDGLIEKLRSAVACKGGTES